MTSVDTVRQDAPDWDEVLTLSEAATYLKIAERTIHRMIQRNEIPCARVGGQWRFLKSVLDDWLLSRMQVLPRNELAALLDATDGVIRLAPLLSEAIVVGSITPGSRSEVLTQLVLPLAERGLIPDVAHYVRLLLARERLSSTALGHGVAVPHVRRPADNPAGAPTIVLGVCRDGADFDAPDERPVRFFFLIGTASELVHLRLLKRISYLFRDHTVGDALLQCDDDTLLEELARHEARVFTGG